MSTAPGSAWRAFGASVATLIGVAFFFAIVGVFGLPASIASLMLFVTLAFLIFRRPQAEETRQ
ncbi:hypothetical protein SAMN05519103_06102 [Rhizobiales bacterium GAS113]|nr:hypothetical protein SAMN05519103_06102 [Rhizobiales bacterium GAS113]